MQTDLPSYVDDIIDSVVEGLPPFVTRAELASLLRCQKNHISALLDSGELVGFQRRAKAGSPVLVPRDAVRRYLKRAAR